MKTKLSDSSDPLFQLYAAVAAAATSRVGDYRALVKHTGGYLSKSMSIAYAKGVNDALQTLLKEITNVKKDQTAAVAETEGRDNEGVRGHDEQTG